MEIKLTAFGIAKDILHQRSRTYTLNDEDTIAILKSKLIDEFPAFNLLASLTFAVNEEYCVDNYIIKSGDHVVIIPPVAGG